MGGGPASADVVRSSCILTFPEETDVEPVPVDAWYLHAVGRTFLRRLARDRVGDELKIALLMQQVDPETQQKRYISVNTDEILQAALKETFDEPDRVLVLHIIALDKVLGRRSIHVRPEINPYVSPEPVAPMDLVFPTLAVEGIQEPEDPTSLLAVSQRMSRSVYSFDKASAHEDVSMDTSKRLSQSVSSLDKRKSVLAEAEVDYTRGFASVREEEEEDEEDDQHTQDQAFSFAAAGAKLVSDEFEEAEIPLARVVSDTEPGDAAARIPSDYVMLELQNGGGLDTMPANDASTFFISTNWHVQADELSASARLSAENDYDDDARAREAALSSSMLDSFVVLERDQASSK
ncbi:hypothetical protein Poli38472_004637 [Pythium oligandrum]|uniref:Uncharacterized protein n=1 Tax=Pythium oligandrum TaxID=41045 RepID=A0A8K1CAT5_PYTOL|nr:hypothetical protein Poli38472_004637 [Pythium oligandrum]|eukprot:TMW59568.1 hypothetical protein Poli38472_004637 [Pythium oligandrum]